MLEQLRAWLNGSREYTQGVLLFKQLSDDTELKALFSRGKTDYCYKRLQTELLSICNDLKSKLDETAKPTSKQTGKEDPTANKQTFPAKAHSAPALENANPNLYAACKLKADKLYKETMNARAVLFAMVPANEFEEPNRPDLVEQRRELALRVVTGSQAVSLLYDRSDYVRIHGKLPDAPPSHEEELALIPDHEVKQKLDNARKARNKHKTREQTPERVALMQQFDKTISILEARWLSLQQKN